MKTITFNLNIFFFLLSFVSFHYFLWANDDLLKLFVFFLYTIFQVWRGFPLCTSLKWFAVFNDVILMNPSDIIEWRWKHTEMKLANDSKAFFFFSFSFFLTYVSSLYLYKYIMVDDEPYSSPSDIIEWRWNMSWMEAFQLTFFHSFVHSFCFI